MLPYSGQVKNMDGAGLRIVAVQRDKFLYLLPSTSTTDEQGCPELDGNDQLVRVSAPAGTPAPILSKLEDAFRSVMSDPCVMKSLNYLEMQPQFVSSENARKWLEDNVRKLSGVIKAAGLTGE